MWKNQYSWSFSSKKPLNFWQKFFQQQCDSLVKNEFSKNLYSGRRVTPSNGWNSSFWDCPYSSKFNFLMWFSKFLNTTNFYLSENADMIYLLLRNKSENVIKIVQSRSMQKKGLHRVFKQWRLCVSVERKKSKHLWKWNISMVYTMKKSFILCYGF